MSALFPVDADGAPDTITGSVHKIAGLEAIDPHPTQQPGLTVWWAWLEQAETRGEFFTATVGFVVLRRKR